MPRFLQIVVLCPATDMYLAQPPVPLQKALFAVLAPWQVCGAINCAIPSTAAPDPP
jgi:hypothetical protein